MDDKAILVETKMRVQHLESTMEEMKEDRKTDQIDRRAELASIQSVIANLSARITALERSMWFAAGAITILQIVFQWVFKNH